jgi:arylsulfatase A-like enzyme
MLHPRLREIGDLIVHPTLSTDDELRPIVERLGPLPPAGVPDTARNRWLARAIAEIVLPETRPEVLFFWHDDPDKSQHKYGFGHPLSLRSIREADDHLGMVLDGLDAVGLRDETLVVVTSDHGYVGIRERFDDGPVVAALASDARVIVAPNGCSALLYLERPDQRSLARLAAEVGRLPGVGVMFSGVRGAEAVDGTFPLAPLGIDGPLAPDLLVTLAWSDDQNEYGFRGVSPELGSTNRASHGGASTWEIHNTLILQGAGVATGRHSSLPSSVRDLAPTLLHALGLAAPDSMTGRVLHEAWASSDSVGTASSTQSAAGDAVPRWEQVTSAGTLRWSGYQGQRYLDEARR